MSNFTAIMYLTSLLMLSWIVKSQQAQVPNCTAPNTATDQCYSVVFSRSVFEGHDTILEPLGGKKNFILTILSSTDLTNQLAGYTVTVHSPCGDSGRVQIYQSGKTSAPNSCDAQVVHCGTQNLTVEVSASPSVVKDNVLYTKLNISLPRKQFNLNIRPKFDVSEREVLMNLKPGSGSAPADLSDVEKNDAKMCDVRIPAKRSVMMTPIAAGIAFAAVFAVLLIVAAIGARYHALMGTAKRNEEQSALFRKNQDTVDMQYTSASVPDKQADDAEIVLQETGGGTYTKKEF